MISLAVGVGWGLWAVWWTTELGKEVDTSVWGFASHAVPCSIPFLLSWLILGLARPDWFQSSKLATILLWGLVVVIFLAARVPSRPSAALILPPLLLLCFVGLRATLAGSSVQVSSTESLVNPSSKCARVDSDSRDRHRRLRRVPQPESASADQRGALRDHDAPGFWFFFRSLWLIFRPRNP